MINSVSSFNNNIQVRKPVQFKGNDFAPAKEESDEGMSTTTKTLIGLGALATAVVGGLLVKRRLDTRAAEKITERAQKLLNKPKDFTKEDLEKLVEDLIKSGKFNENSDKLLVVNKKFLDDLAKTEKNKNSKWSKIYEAMNMSENGFAVIVRKADGKSNNSIMKYFDPEKFSYDDLKNKLKQYGAVPLKV